MYDVAMYYVAVTISAIDLPTEASGQSSRNLELWGGSMLSWCRIFGIKPAFRQFQAMAMAAFHGVARCRLSPGPNRNACLPRTLLGNPGK
jgi:hypothetical protein